MTSRSIPSITVPSQLKASLAAGHPWIYRDHVPANVRLPSGTWVHVQSGNWNGYALWDARSPIALRVFSIARVPDAAWVRDRVEVAWAGREQVRQTPTTAYRLLFGEGDG
ncbi:MAG TPA: class I SAM-dependent rRNA methyltransferase, partial [Herpetosiphonaceae bacterium]|nr:class I SAM-dependent rRNA methyltransferase [Herpetosiphonaceae bacterium]